MLVMAVLTHLVWASVPAAEVRLMVALGLTVIVPPVVFEAQGLVAVTM